jgi:hypothetical protein
MLWYTNPAPMAPERGAAGACQDGDRPGYLRKRSTWARTVGGPLAVLRYLLSDGHGRTIRGK